jgi:hypothetical protein
VQDAIRIHIECDRDRAPRVIGPFDWIFNHVVRFHRHPPE